MKLRFINVLGTVLMVWSSSAQAWNTMGHKVIAEMAYQQLTPAIQKEALRLSKIPVWLAPRTRYFYNISYWADRLPSHGITQYKHWHYIDYPYEKNQSGAAPNSENIVWALRQQYAILSDQTRSDEERAIALRWVVHLVGDLHQPLHCISLYSNEFKQGDSGGNLFLIYVDEKKTKLHAFWDQGGGIFADPHKKMKRRELMAYAAQLKKAFHHLPTRFEPETWAKQSYEIAKTQAYQTPLFQSISESYRQQTQIISAKQSALAAARLAQLLNQALDH